MNEVLITILISIISCFIFLNISYILIKKLKINHPKDKFRIYAMVMTSVFLIFILSFTVVANSLQSPIKIDNSYIKDNEENCSLVVAIDETQLEKDNYLNFKDSMDHDCEFDLCNSDECEFSDSCHHKVLSFFITSPKYLNNIISRLTEIKLDSSFTSLDSEVPINQKTIFSGLNNEKINENPDNDESNFSFFFLIFNIILFLLCIAYLLFSLIFSKKIILKNVNAKKCSDPNVLQMVKKLCKEIKIKTPKVYIFDGDPNAFVFGYPASLVISKNLINCLSEEELRIALTHELAHISNKDHILKPLLQTMRILFFYNPIVHILYYKMINERELLADSKFISSKVEKIRFMEILFKINDYSKKQNLFSRNIYGTSSLLLVSHKMRKVGITDRYNHLFSHSRKKSFITILICLLVLSSNISIIAIAQNNFLNDHVGFNEELETEMCKTDLEDCCNIQNIDTIYILRLIKQKSDLLDIIVIEDTFHESN